jgi:hypothetical protein
LLLYNKEIQLKSNLKLFLLIRKNENSLRGGHETYWQMSSTITAGDKTEVVISLIVVVEVVELLKLVFVLKKVELEVMLVLVE